ncbi:MAG: alpha/beta hydrolase [Pseudomonadota bacterium]|nr:alpha/beta hydrolase [Pseudomonadota bacterium]
MRRMVERATRAMLALCVVAGLVALPPSAKAQAIPSIADIATRPGVTQRVLLLAPPHPSAAVLMFAGGHGGLQLGADGSIKWGAGNFLVRTRQRFVDQGLLVVLIDAPSDRQAEPFLTGFRQRPEHAADIKATLAWLRARYDVPMWLVGTSRGTQSVAYIATELPGRDGPDGIVLTSSIMIDRKGRPVPAMPLDRIRVPVLVVHHEHDECPACPFAQTAVVMAKLDRSPRKQLLAFDGGQSTGDPCEAFAHHGYNGIEPEVVRQIAAWLIAK